MMDQALGEAAQRAARAYGAAADHYGLPSLSFWDRFGGATVSRLGLAAGNTVLRTQQIATPQTDVVFGTAVRPGERAYE